MTQEDGQIVVTRPTDRGEHRALHGLTRSLIANMVEGVTNGFEKRLEIQGVGYRAQPPGQEARACARLLAPGRAGGARRHRLRGPDAHAHRRARHLQAGGRRGRRRSSASSARRSPTRARASATRASTWPGRSVSAHDRQDEAPGAAAPPPPRARQGARHRRAAAAVGVPLEPRHPGAADRRRGRPHAGRRQLDRGRPQGAEAAWSRPSAAGELLAERAKAAGVEDRACSTAAATATTAASRRSPTARARAG